MATVLEDVTCRIGADITSFATISARRARSAAALPMT